MSLFASYVVAVVGAVIALLLVLLARFDPSAFQTLRQGAAEIFAPVARGSGDVTGSVGSLDDTVSAYLRAGSQNIALRRALDRTRSELLEARALRQENRELKALLKLGADNVEAVAVTRLLGSTGSSARRYATLDAGRNRGIESGMPLRAPEGLIGRVLDVGPSVSRVLLLSDVATVVPVRRSRDGLPALASGRGDGNLDIRALNVGINNFERGDIFVTSGTGGLYQPNIPVGIVVATQSDGAVARPLAHPARVTAVLVERAFRDSADVKALPPAEGEQPRDD
jgi:rod shape-determining protein MreC